MVRVPYLGAALFRYYISGQSNLRINAVQQVYLILTKNYVYFLGTILAIVDPHVAFVVMMLMLMLLSRRPTLSMMMILW